MRDEDRARTETNRALWDGWTGIHVDSDFYDVDGFLAGEDTLKEPELQLLGDPEGARILHLQCHFGLDTLSLARRGAVVTGVDFSSRAVEEARELARRAGIRARFVRSDVYDVPQRLAEEFDVVFTTYGVLAWLPDLPRWAEVVREGLRSGGRLILVDFHPVAEMFEGGLGEPVYPYFGGDGPLRVRVEGSYAEPEADFAHDSFQWIHPLEDVLGALLGAGFHLEAFREHPFSPYGCFPYTREVAPGRWQVPGRPGALPLVFSLRASWPGKG